MRKLLIALLLLANVQTGACAAIADPRFTVITVDPATEQLALFLNDETGGAIKRFDQLELWLRHHDKTLRFAMNAGMYHADFSPVGLLVIDGKQLSPLNLNDGSGNFFLKPNGVFLLADSGARVVEASEYPKVAGGVRLATQSGPLLLRHGVIHPAFNPNSLSKLIRNGVGVAGGKVFFVISEAPVNFHEFAVFFRDSLHCADALYLDGTVSSLYLPAQKRRDVKAELGPMIGVIR